MLPPVPCPEDYDISLENGFLPDQLPLQSLPDPYYGKWEAVVANLQALLLSRRLREVINDLPIITTSRLKTPAEWRRAYVLLAFMSHGYIWGDVVPAERVPPPISIPFVQVCQHLELPTVATYAGVCLWNWKSIFPDEPIDTLSNLYSITTFTGSLDESWFYMVSIAMEARGGPTIPLMLDAIAAARKQDTLTVTECLRSFAERLDELGELLRQMYEHCDPHVFYHRIRPFLAGSKNMGDAGLPRGVIFDTGSGHDQYCQFGGGSNAQSSLIQFFDIVLGIEHRPTGSRPVSAGSVADDETSNDDGPTAPPARHNFIHDMRSYMPGPHRRFLEHVSSVANIRDYVRSHRADRDLCLSYDACLAMLRSLRETHIQMVSRYIIVKSRESRPSARSLSPRAAPKAHSQPLNLAKASSDNGTKKELRGTGGTSLIPFLKQARDETVEPVIEAWCRRLLTKGRMPSLADKMAAATLVGAPLGKMDEHADGEREIVGLAGVWKMDDSEGGLGHWYRTTCA